MNESNQLDVCDFNNKDNYYNYKKCIEEAQKMLGYANLYASDGSKAQKLIHEPLGKLLEIHFIHFCITPEERNWTADRNPGNQLGE